MQGESIGFRLSTSPSAAVQDPASAAIRPAPDAALNHATPAALAVAWRQLMLASKEPGISKEDGEVLVEQADAVLGRLAKTPDNTEATLVADVLFGKLRTLA